MAAKKKKTAAKEETPKKRIQPVVEVVEEVEEVEEAPTETEEVVEEVVVEEESPKSATKQTSGVSVEPDFSSGADESDDTEVVEVVEEVAEEPSADDSTEVTEVVEEVVEVPAEDAAEDVTEEVVVEESSDTKAETSKPAKHRNPDKMSIKTVLFITIISALVAAFVSGGVYVYLNGVSELKNSMSSDETNDSTTDDTSADSTPEPTAEPEATPTVSEDLSVYSIEVLNGSGEIGAAGAASDVLEDGGFVVADTGNADNYDYTDTVVRYKAGTNMADVQALVDALEKEYSVELSDDTLSADSEYDFVITVGTD